MNDRKPKKQPSAPPQPSAPKVLHSPGGIRGRWMRNSLSFVLVILAAVVILVSVGVSGYYYASVRDNLLARATQTADIYRKYFTETYDQFYTQAESSVTTYEQKDKVEMQFLDRNGRILLSTSGLTGGGMASTEEAVQALAMQKASVFTGRDPLSDERVMSVTAPLLSSRGELIGGVRVISSLRIAEKQIWLIIGTVILVCLLFLMLVVASNSYFIRSIIEPVLRINTIAKEIAAGRYGVRLQKTYDDEIGELCDTINYMSDEISRAERMKNDFISSVSHELRTPLTAIGGWSETLLAGGGEDPEEVMQGLTIIQKEAGRLTRMVEELLDFARIESGRMKLEVELFDLSVELYEAVYMYENLLQKTGMQLHYDEDVDANYYINGDRHRMKQVFLNILDNAAKYGADGKQIEITLRRAGGRIVAVVRDHGAGIPEAELPFVKEKFYKGSSKQRGSGIGLAVTEEIVSLHGGTLDIASTVGEGTTVTVTLPAADAEEALGITGALPKIADAPPIPEPEGDG
ncbi:MAG: HAMP domain-containing histidine kinase [Agathobaculum sp.]|uniref:sensor histidine kinase n=1 Tax=Agathobaculum sp. TaxID=2048138 RepID=UPI0025BA6C0E|nr:HAMP domain-containing sensor histidine kinase [Agathobaculum sp.]MCI7125913.1 HAMP domain-containing histidine kinase [Agathobaculum sp.]MDY3711072.1 HAMP domain-containing sensor histidine kinase [Agathobaculum sp.]